MTILTDGEKEKIMSEKEKNNIRDIDSHPLYMQLVDRYKELYSDYVKRGSEIEKLENLLKNKEYTFDEYSKERIAAQSDGRNINEQLMASGLGLSGESGEYCEIIKKHFFHGKELNKSKAIFELGDILWYINYAANALGSSLKEVAKMNCAKLRHRYPNGFDINIAKEL